LFQVVWKSRNSRFKLPTKHPEAYGSQGQPTAAKEAPGPIGEAGHSYSSIQDAALEKELLKVEAEEGPVLPALRGKSVEEELKLAADKNLKLKPASSDLPLKLNRPSPVVSQTSKRILSRATCWIWSPRNVPGCGTLAKVTRRDTRVRG
jgi:hypothetical protein